MCSEIRDEFLKKFSDLEAAFKAADIDHNGTLSYSEFLSVIQNLNIANLNDSQIYDLMQSADRNYSGSIDFHEFSRLFKSQKLMDDYHATKQFIKIYRAIQRKGRDLNLPKKERSRAIFLLFTDDHSKHITYSQFRRGLKHILDLRFEKADIQSIATLVDKNDSKSISVSEFVDAVKSAKQAHNDRKWKDNYIQSTLHSLFSSRFQVRFFQ